MYVFSLFFFSFFFSNNKDSLFSDNKYFLTGRAGFHARSNWLGYPFFPRPFNYFSRGYLLHFCERNLSNLVAKIFIKNSEKSLGMRSNSIFKNNKNSMKRIVNKKNENTCSRTSKKNFSGLVSPSRKREREREREL